jgi:hypothetical protein
VCGWSCGGELSSSGRSAEVISDRCTDTNGKVLIKMHRKEPAANDPAVGALVAEPFETAPGTRNRHIVLFGHLIPGEALVAQLQDLMCGGGMCGRTWATHGDAGTTELIARSLMDPGPDAIGPANRRRVPYITVRRGLPSAAESGTGNSRSAAGSRPVQNRQDETPEYRIHRGRVLQRERYQKLDDLRTGIRGNTSAAIASAANRAARIGTNAGSGMLTSWAL